MKQYRFIIFFIAIALMACTSGTQISFRSNPEEQTIQDCGFSFSCGYYNNQSSPEGEIEFVVSTNDSIENIGCNKILTPNFVTLKFPNCRDTLNLHHVNTENSHHYSTDKDYPTSYYNFRDKHLIQMVQENDSIEVRFSFASSEKERNFFLKKHEEQYRTKDNQIFMLLAIILIVFFVLWFPIYYAISSSLKQYSPRTNKIIASVVTLGLFILVIIGFINVFLGC